MTSGEGGRRRGLTDGLRGNQVTEEGGEHDKDHGVGNPGEVLERNVAFKLPVDPLIGWKTGEGPPRRGLKWGPSQVGRRGGGVGKRSVLPWRLLALA